MVLDRRHSLDVSGITSWITEGFERATASWSFDGAMCTYRCVTPTDHLLLATDRVSGI
jgi:hypothetical protein